MTPISPTPRLVAQLHAAEDLAGSDVFAQKAAARHDVDMVALKTANPAEFTRLRREEKRLHWAALYNVWANAKTVCARTIAEPECCGTPMVHYPQAGYECADAYFALVDDDAITQDGATPPRLRDDTNAEHNELLAHLKLTRLAFGS